MEDILSGVNGRNVLQLAVGEFDAILEPAPIQNQKIKAKPVLNRISVHLRKVKRVTPRNVVRKNKHSGFFYCCGLFVCLFLCVFYSFYRESFKNLLKSHPSALK